MEKIIDYYYKKFNSLPPLIIGINEKSEKYLQLVKQAIEKNKPLTNDDLTNFLIGNRKNVLI